MRNERQDGRQGEGALTWKIRSTAAGLHRSASSGAAPTCSPRRPPSSTASGVTRCSELEQRVDRCPRGCETLDNMKKVELVAPEEIAAAIEKVVGDSFGMDRAEIPASVLRQLLGFRRTTEGAQRRGRPRGGRCVLGSGRDVLRCPYRDGCSRRPSAQVFLLASGSSSLWSGAMIIHTFHPLRMIAAGRLFELTRINACPYTPIIIRAFHLLGRLRCGLQ